MKDLPDIALLAGVREIDGEHLRRAFQQTFTSRKMQGLPTAFPAPPPSWAAPYARMVAEDDLRWRDLATLTKDVSTFLDPVLNATAATWRPNEWAWR